MPLAEPLPTALLLATVGALLAASAIFSRASERIGVPLTLAFLGIGVLAGAEGIGGIAFENYPFAFRLGTIALVLILFDGGLNTPLEAVRRALAPAALLATLGVVGTAALVAAGAHALGFGWAEALLLGAVVSSTDAATVFSVLRGSGIHLKRRVGTLLEVESGMNDPMAVILTTLLTRNLVSPQPVAVPRLLLDVVVQIAVGVALGYVVGHGGRRLLARVRLSTSGLYAVLTLALALLAFGVPTLLLGSGFLAVYVAAVILGNGALPYRAGLLRVHDALAWMSQIAMFLVLGLLVSPVRLAEVWWVGLALALFLAVVARPVVTTLLLLPFRFPARELLYIGVVGLRGAVPIILATIPVIAGVPDAARIFDVVFFIVLANAFVPGMLVPWATERLGIASPQPPAPQAVLEIESMRPLRGDFLSFYIDPALAVAGVAIADLQFPEGSAVTLIVRGDELVAPKGNTILERGDHVYVFAHPEERALIQLMFGKPEE
ncbi:MAG TPA: potassium/proton antiporter [Gemmatimonadaceae bacterium]|nr:potassium/proton antiporter [Gemmatimonadaceae bacterium]